MTSLSEGWTSSQTRFCRFPFSWWAWCGISRQHWITCMQPTTPFLFPYSNNQVYGFAAMGRSNVHPEAQVRKPEYPAGNVLPESTTLFDPRRYQQASSANGRCPRFPYPFRQKSRYLAGHIYTFLPPLHRTLRAPSSKFLHLQQGRRTNTRSHHLR